MSDNRKYYYLKLKESYFDDDAIVLLESMHGTPGCRSDGRSPPSTENAAPSGHSPR